MQQVKGGRETTTGCQYGNKAGYAKLLDYVQALNAVAHPPGAPR
jgi:hypothetical protein